MRSSVWLGSLVLAVAPLQAQGDSIDVWLGTRRSKLSKGIYHCRLDTKTGKLTPSILAAEIRGPGFLAMHPKEPVLYAVGALDRKPVVAAYGVRTDEARPSLERISATPIGDGGSAHVAVRRDGSLLLTAQYGGGSVAAFALARDGRVEKRVALVEHEGGSRVHPRRQRAPHPHWVGFSPDQRFAFVPDLGLDKVVVYRLGEDRTLTHAGFGVVPPGGGPRHMKFHPNARWAYVLNELTLSVTRFDYDAETGAMNARETVPTVDKELLAKERFKSASEIRVHPTGRFVYSANRGHDTITVFRVDEASGELSVVEVENARAITPRNFNIDPSGRWLLVAGQDSHNLASFAIDPKTGELMYNRSSIFVPSPICVLFAHE